MQEGAENESGLPPSRSALTRSSAHPLKRRTGYIILLYGRQAGKAR